MNTNNISISDFGSTIALVINKMAIMWTSSDIKTFTYEFLRIRLCDYGKPLVESKYFDNYCGLILNLDDVKMESFKNAMIEYSKVMH